MAKTRTELLAELEAAALAYAGADARYHAAFVAHPENYDRPAGVPLHPETVAALEAIYAPRMRFDLAASALYSFDNPETAVPLALAAPGEAVQF